MENLPPSVKPEARRRVRAVTRHDPTAPDNVGVSVKVPKRKKAKQAEAQEASAELPPVADFTEPKVVSLDRPPEWVDEPTMKDQVRNKDMVKLDRQEAKIFNLSDEKDLAKYNELLARTSDPNTNCFIIQEDRQFAPALGTFQVFVKLQYVKFRKVLTTKKD